jgi:hypothetical protein
VLVSGSLTWLRRPRLASPTSTTGVEACHPQGDSWCANQRLLPMGSHRGRSGQPHLTVPGTAGWLGGWPRPWGTGRHGSILSTDAELAEPEPRQFRETGSLGQLTLLPVVKVRELTPLPPHSVRSVPMLCLMTAVVPPVPANEPVWVEV